MKGSVNFKGFMAKEITPNSEFYITTYSDMVPAVNPKSFCLRVEGLVENPSALTIRELEAMKDTTEFVILECIGNPVGGDAIGNALWDGVRLKTILEKAVPKKDIVKAIFYAEDGYTDSIPYSLANTEDVFLAFRMNGEPLPAVHGYPLRAIVPARIPSRSAPTTAPEGPGIRLAHRPDFRHDLPCRCKGNPCRECNGDKIEEKL